MNNKLKKIIFDLIDTKTKGVDTYHHNGSMWLIFTDQKKWVIEFTKHGTLWYNFIFFQQFFRYLSLDVIENQHYITEWVEAILKNGVGYTSPTGEWEPVRVEDTIQNGVRSTDSWAGKPFVSVESIIQNGVINTRSGQGPGYFAVEDTIQNGIIDTCFNPFTMSTTVEDTIQNGVKETTPSGYLGSIEMKGKIVHQFESPKQNNEVEDTIQNGVRNTGCWQEVRRGDVEDAIQYGVKETKQEPSQRTWKVDQVITETHDDIYNHKSRIEGVIKNGIKETKTPGEDGDLMSTLDFLSDNNSVSVPKMIDDIISNGIKETKKLEHDRTTYHGYFNQERGSHTPLDTVQDVIENGIKEVKELPDQSGELNGYGEYYARQKNRTHPHTDTVNDVIRDGVKETNWRTVENFPEFEERVIQNGIKETWGYERQPQTKINDVIQSGKKI